MNSSFPEVEVLQKFQDQFRFFLNGNIYFPLYQSKRISIPYKKVLKHLNRKLINSKDILDRDRKNLVAFP